MPFAKVPDEDRRIQTTMRIRPDIVEGLDTVAASYRISRTRVVEIALVKFLRSRGQDVRDVEGMAVAELME